MSDLRALPSVDVLLQSVAAVQYIAEYGRPLTIEALRTALAEARQSVIQGHPVTHNEHILKRAAILLTEWLQPSLISVINASGVVLHTNLGRAPLSRASIEAVDQISSGYCTLEYDLERGSRGSRTIHAEALLQRITGAEAALVVNNNAAAVLLTLSALARRQRAIISRTQLVEIGGGFRIPEVMSQSGTRLVEIGATNRVNLQDYQTALEEPTALVLNVHHSNFRIVGFTSEPPLSEIVAAAHAKGVPVMNDLGSGTFLNTAKYGLAYEPTIADSLAAGADITCFSGDKLLGGPQAGIIIGSAAILAKIKKHPLARAVRADKLCLAALSATLLHYLKDEAEREIPIWRMISQTPEHLHARAMRWAKTINYGQVIKGLSTIGGGSLPEETLPTYLFVLDNVQPNRFVTRLRAQSPPIIARIENGCVAFDPRTVLPEQEGAFLAGIQKTLA